ncbi:MULTISPECIES: hypothetical protein [Listeria]|uniref:Uncharacterized protein n=2 Tax=Listeriaceae TaxID=186820 RepID=A0A7X0X4U2_9LIST|nr:MULTISPECIES: hypothetical protein [Listeria]MBC1487575.1 hypothetical protein [Listeria immobilis]MBC1510664.1 hypothetical protein [Listeria immobilis]MBC6296615.1 hypothetical protein [Listeria immobilis]PZG34089.1 hypothetical protein C2D64_06695 [Listeria ivanovii]PZG48416.1 hypothetical protein C2D66_05120 [Listeria ivanovii]
MVIRHLFFIDLFTNDKFEEIGTIRILHKDKHRTGSVIPNQFTRLNDEFISLGMNKEFYSEIINVLGKTRALSVLEELHDISIIGLDNNPYFEINNQGIQDSFFRSSDARYLYEEVLKVYFTLPQNNLKKW